MLNRADFDAEDLAAILDVDELLVPPGGIRVLAGKFLGRFWRDLDSTFISFSASSEDFFSDRRTRTRSIVSASLSSSTGFIR